MRWRPRGRMVDSNLNFLTVALTHFSSPSGRPRWADNRKASSSLWLSGWFTRDTQRGRWNRLASCKHRRLRSKQLKLVEETVSPAPSLAAVGLPRRFRENADAYVAQFGEPFGELGNAQFVAS